MYKDKTNLFKNSRLQLLSVAALLFVAIFSLIMMFKKSGDYKSDVKHSSTPMGTQMQFEKSQSGITLSGIYTDEANSVLIARLSTDNTAQLPFKGLNYNVYLASDTLKNYTNQKTDILFGRLGVDGDLFLVIPKPLSEIYTAVISNKKYMGINNINTKSDKTSLDDISFAEAQKYEDNANTTEDEEARATESVAKMLSQVRPSLSGDINSQSQSILNDDANYSEDKLDLIAFRIGTVTAKNEPQYTPIVLKGQLLVNNKFQFESFFNQVFKDEAVKQTKAANDRLQQAKKTLKEAIADYDERLLIEPNSAEIISAKSEAENKITNIEEQQKELNEKLNKYNELTYSEDFFNNLQTKATVINPADYGLSK